MKYYVTLFDSDYMTRGLVMYRSLLHHSGEFHLWIICFDNLAYELLEKLNLEKVTLVTLEQFEDLELLRIKRDRTRQEYCWTCTPSTVLYVLNNAPHVDAVTYLDADLMFFSSPEPIFTEAGEASIIITEHRYLPKFDQSATSGIYNVQFIMFRRNSEGLKAANWWRDRCLEWCFARCEDNKFGDQKYLDDWLERFQDVHVLQHLGAGLAPWNADQYHLQKIDEIIYVEDHSLIFYHFHRLSLHPFKFAYVGTYPTSIDLHDLVYREYLKHIDKAYRDVWEIAPEFNGGIVSFLKPYQHRINFLKLLKNLIIEIIKGKYRKYA